ncbi:unnamed protein product [Ambrosiozyma monospora]|uniref:Unnamed protein product n=1 Tax=Ambrosiozyma monospora TaxID=43982 RepID=A0A9W6Z1Y8_AMBMO|nr:unnamed protein product [Ambrosiozyma monospora]
MATWSPLPQLLCGRVLKPFTPLSNPQLAYSDEHIRKHFKNIYPGDLVYLFETESSYASAKWGRGYLVSHPNPSYFSSATVSLEKLPESQVSICILPLSHLKILRELDLSSNPNEDFKENVIMDYSYLPDIADDASITSSAIGPAHRKAQLPTLPVNDVALSSKGLTEEIELALKALAVNLFALFTKGNLGHFKKLFAVFVELDNLRTGFENQLLTNHEVQLANRECAYLLTKISKIAAAANLTIYENSSVKKSKDISGSECILARDENSGELFTSNTETSTASPINPAKLALSQVFCALAPNYPVINSNTPLIPPKNGMLDQKPPAHILVDFQAVEGSSNLLPIGYAGMTAYLYLRNSKKRLTESFALSITPDEQFSLESISAALFKNIPANEIDNGRIYLK